jgi:integral membrane sensor domain MASE1
MEQRPDRGMALLYALIALFAIGKVVHGLQSGSSLWWIGSYGIVALAVLPAAVLEALAWRHRKVRESKHLAED